MTLFDVSRARRAGRHAAIVLLGALAAASAFAGTPTNNTCEPGETPDVILGSIHQTTRWGTTSNKTSFTIGTWSCNVGDCQLNWFSNTNDHPVIAQNMYRLKDGRFEQLGLSWLKHGFFALSQTLCNTGCIGTDGTTLGVNCADPYTSSRNGQQSNLGPRFEVNASTGVYPYPFSSPGGSTGNVLHKRIQVDNADLDPALNPGATYYVEGQYVTKDDAAAGNQDNNASWRAVNVSGSGSTFNIQLTGITHQTEPAVFAWKLADPEVELTLVDVSPTDGIYWVGAKATDLGNGYWDYEYAIFNLNSDRSARAFRVPVLAAADVSSIGFRDVDYHSGEPFDGTDWTRFVDTDTVPAQVTWETQTFAQNANANALRWGTLYNYRFVVDLPPQMGQATLDLFKPGTPASMQVNTIVPTLCNSNGVCDLGEPTCECVTDCVPPPVELSCTDGFDDDCDGLIDCLDPDCCVGEGGACAGVDQDGDSAGICEDCDDLNNTVWSTPTEAQDLIWQDLPSGFTLFWQAPAQPGANAVYYEVLRSSAFADFLNPTCLVPFNPQQKRLTDTHEPSPGAGFYYLVRGTNDCPDGVGPAGTASDGSVRQAGACK